jgi:hypothetical protein
MLSTMTDRVFSAANAGYATPLPLPFEEDQLQEDPVALAVLKDPKLRERKIDSVMSSSYIRQTAYRAEAQIRDQSWVKSLPINSELCYLYYCDLTVIITEILEKVDSSSRIVLSRLDLESRLGYLSSRLDSWRSNLPTTVDFTQSKGDESPDMLRCKLALGFQYYSARITLSRSCLCRDDECQSDSSQVFSHTVATTALEAASDMISLIPDEPNVSQLHQVCPWWCVLQQLSQAASIILLELSLGSAHMLHDEQRYVRLAKKCLNWFFAIPTPSSQHAWQLCDSRFREIARDMRYTTDDLPSYPYQQDYSTTMTASQLAPQPRADASAHSHGISNSHLEHHPLGLEQGWTSYFSSSDFGLTSLLRRPGEMADSYFPYDMIADSLSDNASL